jgi:hypothetical protein
MRMKYEPYEPSDKEVEDWEIRSNSMIAGMCHEGILLLDKALESLSESLKTGEINWWQSKFLMREIQNFRSKYDDARGARYS